MISFDNYWWIDVIDFNNNFVKINVPIYPKDTISNNFFRQCIFSKKSTLYHDMTLVCGYEVDSVTKKLYLCYTNTDEKYSELISDINMKFDIMHRSWGLI